MKGWLTMLLMLLSQSVFATAQIPERLLLDGKSRILYTNPLDAWLRQSGNADRLKPYVSERRCTASWRGYAGTWEISGGKLYLASLHADPCSQSKKEIRLQQLFGQASPIHAVWYTGQLTVPDGKQIKYVHMGYGSRYERYILIQIERGIVLRQEIVTELPGAHKSALPSD